jgi:hypothetical protein
MPVGDHSRDEWKIEIIDLVHYFKKVILRQNSLAVLSIRVKVS